MAAMKVSCWAELSAALLVLKTVAQMAGKKAGPWVALKVFRSAASTVAWMAYSLADPSAAQWEKRLAEQLVTS